MPQAFSDGGARGAAAEAGVPVAAVPRTSASRPPLPPPAGARQNWARALRSLRRYKREGGANDSGARQARPAATLRRRRRAAASPATARSEGAAAAPRPRSARTLLQMCSETELIQPTAATIPAT